MIPVCWQGSCPDGCEPCSRQDQISTGISHPVPSQGFLVGPPNSIYFPYNVRMPETLLRMNLLRCDIGISD